MRACLTTAMLLALCGGAGAADCSALKIENSVKMEPLARYGLMVVPITLNGSGKKFLLDTGGALSVISRAAVQDLKLPEYHSNYHSSDLYGEDSDTFVQVHDVAFGAAKTSGVQFQVMANFGFAKGNAPFDGVISTGLFLHDDVDLDFGAERVNFFSPDHCEGRVVYWPHQVLSVVPVRLEQGHIDVPVMLDGHELTAMLDTGATNTLLKLDRAERKIGFLPQVAPGQDGPKDDPAHQAYFRRFHALSFDGVTVQNPMIAIQPLETGGRQAGTVIGSRAQHVDDDANRLSPDMIVGMDVLRHLHVYIAVREQRLYVSEAGQGESVLFKGQGESSQAAGR